MKINFKSLLIFIIFIAFMVSIFIAFERNALEVQFKHVELAMSLNMIRELSLQEGYDENNLLSLLKEKGISGIAVHEDTIEMLSFQGRIALLNTNNLAALSLMQEHLFYELNPVGYGDHLLICRDYGLFQRLRNFFYAYLGKDRVEECVIENNRYCLKIQGIEEELIKIGTGFSQEDIEKVKNIGFNVILRPKNTPKVTPEIIQHKLSSISAIEDISMIIFDEEEALGFPSGEMLSKTAAFLRENHYPFGIIEFASQEGIHAIAAEASEMAVRVHSITREEMETVTANTAVDRWIRGAQERNIRLFYINPFLKLQGRDLIQSNLDYIEQIRNELTENGYHVGQATLLPSYQIPLYLFFIIASGIISGAVLLLGEFIAIPGKYMFLLFTAGIIFLPLLYLLAGKIFLLKILALASALIFPVLAIIKNKDYFLKISQLKKENDSYSYLEMFKRIMSGITGIMLISLLCGLLIGALLTHHQFLLAIQLFSGIKIAYIFPLMLIFIFFWWASKEKKLDLWEDLRRPILFEHALLVFIFLVFVVIYISRSGNFSFLPVPAIEEKMRLFLEKILVARPRSKEFLIGYPLLSLAIAMNYLNLHYLKYPVIVMGSVAPVTVVNTFCHVHTSIYFSLLRTFHGYWLGLLIGIILSSIVFLFHKIFRVWFNGKRNE